MIADSGQDQFAEPERTWVPHAVAESDPVVARAQALAHATLVSTSMKVLNVRAAAQSTLLDAHARAEEVLIAAQELAENICQEAETRAEHSARQILAGAQRDADTITDRAQSQRDLLVSATLERIAVLSTDLIGMADRIIAHAEDPAVARSQLAQFMLALTDMAEQVNRDEPSGATPA